MSFRSGNVASVLSLRYSTLQAKEEMAWKIAKMIIEDVKNEQGSTAGLWTEEDSVA